MSFIESIQTCTSKFADFTGRAARPEFWWFTLFVALVSAALQSFNIGSTEGTLYLGTSLSGIWSVVTLLPFLAVATRRLRDTGRSWHHLFWFLVPIAGLIVLAIYLAEPGKTDD